jgi:hypothetical protein
LEGKETMDFEFTQIIIFMTVGGGLILVYVDIDMSPYGFLLSEFRFFEADRGS